MLPPQRKFPSLTAPRVAVALLLLLVVGINCGGDSHDEPTPSPTTTLRNTTIVFTNDAGENIDLTVEIACTAEERARGLMARKSLAEDHGMLFDFGGEADAGFWMKDTLLPLSIAFISSEGRIINIQDMQPLSEELHGPPQPYFYAVEANQGWFERNGIGIGSTQTKIGTIHSD